MTSSGIYLECIHTVYSMHTPQNTWCFQSGCRCTTISCSYQYYYSTPPTASGPLCPARRLPPSWW